MRGQQNIILNPPNLSPAGILEPASLDLHPAFDKLQRSLTMTTQQAIAKPIPRLVVVDQKLRRT
jgi:hypothetical protein